MRVATEWRAFCSGAVVYCVVASAGGAQEIRKSQLATVTQMVADTRMELRYRRPVARGRELFGALVPWGRVWSPSADTAAVFSVSTDIRLQGASLKAGSYSLWAIPGADEWTIILSSIVPVFHMRYSERGDVLRVKAKPRAGDHVESLAFYFPTVDADSAELILHWGKTAVPLTIKARP